MTQKYDWKHFKRLKLDKKSFRKHARRAETLTTKHAHKFVLQRLTNIRNVRRHIINWLSIVAVLILVVALQQMWYRNSYLTTASSSGGTYAEGALGPVESLNPLYAQTSAEVSATRLLFSSLFDYDEIGGIRGDIAKTISIDDTGKIYTVSLRPDVYWHDGKKLTAEDIVFTVNAMKNPAARATMQSSWRNITATADSLETVRFTLPNSLAAFEHALTFAVLPKHLLESVDPVLLRENQFSLSPVGSGPFSMRYLQTTPTRDGEKRVVHLSSWDRYYRGKPKLTRFQLHAYPRSADIITALKTHEVNAALDINDQHDKVPSGFSVEHSPVGSGVYAQFNTESTILSDQKVREALQLGTDTDALRKSLGFKAKKLDTPVLPNHVPSVQLPEKPKTSVVTALSRLEEAGWKLDPVKNIRVKDGASLEIRLASVKDRQYNLITEFLTKQWKQLGIKVIHEEFDPAANPQSFLQSVLQPRSYDVLINELVLGADPDVFAYWHSSQANSLGLNFSNYKNSISDDVLVGGRLRGENQLRDQKYLAFTGQWLKDIPAIGLYQSTMTYARSKNVRANESGSVLPTKTDRYGNILYWSAEQSSVYKTP